MSEHKKGPWAYIRLFKKDKCTKEDLSKLMISDYFPAPMASVLYSTYIHKDSYIICPLYDKGDIQIGVTGGVHQKERNYNAIMREIAEEIGLIPNPKKLYEIYSHFYRNKTWTCYTARISDTIRVKKEEHDKKIKGTDNKSLKVGCIVHGTEFNAKLFLNKPIYRYYSTDTIVGVAALPYSYVLQAVLMNRLLK